MSFTNITPFCMVPVEFIGLLSGAEIEIWCCLADWDDTGRDKELHPRIETIARRLGKARRAIENGLRSIEEKTDRLERINVPGESNVYRLNMNKRESQAPRVKREEKLTQGAQKSAEGVRRKVRSNNKEVNKNLINNSPLPPKTGEERGVSLETVELHSPVTYAEFSKIYPRIGADTAAQRAWVNLNELEKRDALAGARKVAAIYLKTPKKRLRYTQTASKWLNAQAWDISDEMLESHFEVPDFFAEKMAWDAQKKLTKELQEWESVRWAELREKLLEEKPELEAITNFAELPQGIQTQLNFDFKESKGKWLAEWHKRAKAAARADTEVDDG